MAAKMTAKPYYYLQWMVELENRHADVYLKFVNGRHVVRRSNKFWAGLSSDLVIEQTLMRSLKTGASLTHDRLSDNSTILRMVSLTSQGIKT